MSPREKRLEVQRRRSRIIQVGGYEEPDVRVRSPLLHSKIEGLIRFIELASTLHAYFSKLAAGTS
ncbi:hypothetical protein OGM63_05520 [Plectonema radiosum NIES-515]|uniref:Uncharacterized protein n=1 Tax=Plectonema radiosum NIES-515 TaxID=2986073 RepID=A0ABT3AV59_9CYAN|nr:hypothetical protein [Plectonema radiosum]MCV3212991.1 hypothetical protein [Plectonema radiosum NIES-515]